ncbi:PIN domain-containing protein, partial [Rikenella microfusus]
MLDPRAFLFYLIATPMLPVKRNRQPRRADIPCITTPIKVAVLVDGGYFLKRYNALYNKGRSNTPETVANDIYRLAHSHVGNENYLYRIFYYDCLPLDKRVHHPLSQVCIN